MKTINGFVLQRLELFTFSILTLTFGIATLGVPEVLLFFGDVIHIP